jgi:thiol-disulfide isomerase/thioredoxin
VSALPVGRVVSDIGGGSDFEFPLPRLTVPDTACRARQGVPAGDFQLRALDGRMVRLSDYRGKVVLLNFWTTWCPACVGEMPALNALQE